MLGGGRWRVSLPELLTALTPPVLALTAPAMAAAKGWHDQVTPGVLVGVMGYAWAPRWEPDVQFALSSLWHCRSYWLTLPFGVLTGRHH